MLRASQWSKMIRWLPISGLYPPIGHVQKAPPIQRCHPLLQEPQCHGNRTAVTFKPQWALWHLDSDSSNENEVWDICLKDFQEHAYFCIVHVWTWGCLQNGNLKGWCLTSGFGVNTITLSLGHICTPRSRRTLQSSATLALALFLHYFQHGHSTVNITEHCVCVSNFSTSDMGQTLVARWT